MVEVNKPFVVIPGIVYAILLDSVDFVGAIKTFIAVLLLPFLGPLGLAVDVVLDGLIDFAQGIFALFVFKDPRMWQIGTAVELLAIPGFDVIPSYTGVALLIDLGVLK